MEKTVFEFVAPQFTLRSEASDGAKIYDIRAISVTVTGNRREYTRKELTLAARSLSYRPLNINHDHSKFLPYPENETLVMDFDPIQDAVVGQMIVKDEWTNKQIEQGKIRKLSIEQFPTRGEKCDLSKCTQEGVVFTALGLLTEDVQAGDPSTKIKEHFEFTESYTCEDCGEKFKNKKDLDNHYEEEHEENNESVISDIVFTVLQKRLGELESRILEKYALLQSLKAQQGTADNEALKQLINQVSDELRWLVQDYIQSLEQAQKYSTQNESIKKIIAEFSQDNCSVKSESQTVNQTMTTQTDDKTKTEQTTSTDSNPAPSTSAPITSQSTQLIAFSKEQWEQFMSSQQKQLEALTSALGILTKKESAASNTESSSQVDPNVAKNSYYESTVVKPAKFFEDAKNQVETEQSYIQWTLNKEEILSNAPKNALFRTKTVNYAMMGSTPKGEAITISAGDMPQVFSKQAILIKGGRMSIPLRQFCDIQEIKNADRVNWYTITGFDVDDTTSEGTEPTNKSQTVGKVQAVPALKRAVQTVNYSDIENTPFDLVEAVNQAAVLGSIGVENNEIINTVPDAVTPDNNDKTKMHWIRGDDGEPISTDDIAGLAAADPKFLTSALARLEDNGHDTSAGNVVAVLHPQTIRRLLDAIGDKYYAQEGAVTMRSLGVLERRYGIDIVSSNKVKFVDNATNPDVYRNYVFIKGAIGLGVAANLMLEAQKKVELSAIKVSARFRMKAAIIDPSQIIRCSVKA